MLIPFGHEPTAEERYKQSYLSRLRKAEHLSARLKQFIDDVNASKLKEKDKIAVKEAALNFLKISSNVPVSGQLPPNPITDKEWKDVIKMLYPKDKGNNNRR